MEGRLVHVPPGADREAARQRAIEARRCGWSPAAGPLKIVQTPQGWVVAAAGIDASNVAADALVLLPEDADASARALRARLRDLLGVDVAVVVSDTFGRTWREGLTDVAVGSAGIVALTDHRGAGRRPGQPAGDDAGGGGRRARVGRRPGEGQARRRPGRRRPRPARRPARRRRRRGHPAAASGCRPTTSSPTAPRDLVGSRTPGGELVPRAGELAAVAEAFRVASAALPEFPVVLRYGGEDDGVVDVHLTDAVTTTTALNLGALLGAAIVQLHAEGWATRWEPVGTPGGSSLVGRLWLGSPAAAEPARVR